MQAIEMAAFWRDTLPHLAMNGHDKQVLGEGNHDYICHTNPPDTFSITYDLLWSCSSSTSLTPLCSPLPSGRNAPSP